MKQLHHRYDLIGILGGMGPLASMAFLSTMYDMTQAHVEQESGRFILYSDPTIPDRTEAFLAQRDEMVLEPFVAMLRSLQQLQVAKIVVCCVTLHYLFPRLPEDLRKLIPSLIDSVFEALRKSHERHLLLCTNGTLQLNIFQRHPLWEQCSDAILLPNERDQQAVHALIYQLKAGQDIRIAATMVQELLNKYEVESFIAGCTEFHLLSRYIIHINRPAYKCLDPLAIIADELVRGKVEI